MRTRTIIFSVALAAITTAGAFAGSDILGRDVAKTGSLDEVSGSLVCDADEWFLKNSAGLYELHLGPIGHEGSLPFAEGALATARGFVVDEHIAPLSVTTGGESFGFWDESRFPLWAGEGKQQNAVEDRPGAATRNDLGRLYQNQDQRPGRGR